MILYRATCRLYLAQVSNHGAGEDELSSTGDGRSGPAWVEYEVNTAAADPSRVKSPRGKLDMRISGSAIIDEIIHEMIDYIIRDYVHSWYNYVSDDDEFIHELRAAIQEALVNLSTRYVFLHVNNSTEILCECFDSFVHALFIERKRWTGSLS